MNHTAPALSVRRPASSTTYGVRTCATMQVPLGAVAALKPTLAAPGQPPYPPLFLKSSNEQTIVGLATILQAIARGGLAAHDFSSWGIIAAPRFVGRMIAAETLHRYRLGGPWKVSPMVVPHNSLHAISGTITQALQIKGLNYGVGGGPNHVVEGLLTAITLTEERQLPGLWVVLTRNEPEPEPDDSGSESMVPTACQAIALALTPVAEDWSGLRLRLAAGERRASAALPSLGERAQPFTSLLSFLARDGAPAGSWSYPLHWGAQLCLSDER